MKASLFLIAAGLTCFYGWVVNIIALVHAPAIALWGGLEIMRAIGVFIVSFGAVLWLFA